jgi:hypothetical protein
MFESRVRESRPSLVAARRGPAGLLTTEPTLPQRREGGPQLLNEQVGLFKGSKVTTPIKLIPVDQV